MAHVYRVQNRAGYGPYWTLRDYASGPEGQVRRRLSISHGYNNEHPGARRDFEPSIQRNEYCGFRTREQAEKWFDGFLSDLAMLGFFLVKVRAASIRTGKSGKQVLFQKHRRLMP